MVGFFVRVAAGLSPELTKVLNDFTVPFAEKLMVMIFPLYVALDQSVR